MNITIFGATGMVGKHLVNQALAQGHTVRAFGRNPFETFSTERKNLELFKGYVFQDDDIEEALKDTDAVLSALGGGTAGVDKTRSLGMKKIVAAMAKTGVRRIIAIGGLGILNADEDKLLFQTPKFPQQFKAVSMEHFKAWEHLAASNLDWTMVCPPVIADAESTGHYETRKNYPVGGAGQVAAGDLAAFMVKELTDNGFLKCRVGIL